MKASSISHGIVVKIKNKKKACILPEHSIGRNCDFSHYLANFGRISQGIGRFVKNKRKSVGFLQWLTCTHTHSLVSEWQLSPRKCTAVTERLSHRKAQHMPDSGE